MKIVCEHQPRAIASALTNQEVIDEVRHLYPRLGATLNTAMTRFQELVDYHAANPQPIGENTQVPSCPHCGSKLKFSE